MITFFCSDINSILSSFNHNVRSSETLSNFNLRLYPYELQVKLMQPIFLFASPANYLFILSVLGDNVKIPMLTPADID